MTTLELFKDRVLVTEMEFGITYTPGGFMLPDDDGKSHGIKSRWARVYKVGPDVTGLKVGDYVSLKHGRWTRAFDIDIENEGQIKIYMVDYPDAVLMISKERPEILDRLHKTFDM